MKKSKNGVLFCMIKTKYKSCFLKMPIILKLSETNFNWNFVSNNILRR